MTDETKQVIGEAVQVAFEKAEETVRHPLIKKLAAFGFYTKGVLFVVVGGLATLLAVGLNGGRLTDARGALAAIAEEPSGRYFLLVFVLGAIGHGMWNILRAMADVDSVGRNVMGVIVRSASAGIGLFYLGLAVSALEIITAESVTDASSQAEETFVAVLTGVPVIGSIIIVLIGLGVIGAGLNECYSGLSGRYRDNYKLWQISGGHLLLIKLLGILSFTVRAVLLGIMGYFFIRAGFGGSEAGAIGMDAALLTLLRTTFGRTLVLIAGIGLTGHGILAFYEARYRRKS